MIVQANEAVTRKCAVFLQEHLPDDDNDDDDAPYATDISKECSMLE